MRIHPIASIASSLVIAGMLQPYAMAKTTPYFSPYDDCESVIISQLETAKHQVLISCYGLSSAPIEAEILKLKAKGVTTTICVDMTQSAGSSDKTKELAQKGIEVVTKPIHTLEHNKFMVIDDKIVITGSYNFSKSAAKQDNNIEVITEEPSVVAKFKAAWKRIYDRDKGECPEQAAHPRKSNKEK